jgi:hypothetical protein
MMSTDKKMISIYSGLSDSELEKLHGYFTEKYGRFMLDESLPIKERHLTWQVSQKSPDLAATGGFLPPNGAPAPLPDGADLPALRKQELFYVQESDKEVLYRQFFDMSLLIYLAMQKTKQWGVLGEQRISISLCRAILRIKNDSDVTQWDADRFGKILQECDKRYGNLPGEELVQYCKDKPIVLFGKEYVFFNQLRDFITLLDADYYLFVKGGPFCAEYIFGSVTWQKIGDIDIYTFQDEYIRSPMHCLSIAGRSPNPMQIRHVAMEVIYHNNWDVFLARSKAERRRALRHPNTAIRDRVKETALLLYGAETKDKLKNKKVGFIDDMESGVVYHELGHWLSEQGMDPVYWAIRFAIAEDPTPCCALEELLAEFAPVRGEKMGAIAHILEVARGDPQKAAALFYVFMSDNWYVDEEEEFLALRSNTYLALSLYFIRSARSVDFTMMENEHSRIYAFLLDKYRRLLETYLDLFYRTVYQKGGRAMSYQELEADILRQWQEKDPDWTIDKMKQNSGYWSGIVNIHLKSLPEGWKQYEDITASGAVSLEFDILALITGGNTMQYNNSLRQYIIERCKELGIYQVPREIDWKGTVQEVCAKLGITQKESEWVQGRFEKIFGGTNYDVQINYDGKPDPFILALQEMLIESGYGAILSPMLVGDDYNPGTCKTARERSRYITEFVKDSLLTLRDQLEAEMYSSIDLLRLNPKYPIEALVEQALKTIASFNGTKLATKIKMVESAPLDSDSDALMEVFIPLRRGYMDWNTAQAIWRINQDLRPDEFMVQWIVDAEFLTALFEAYV